MRPLVVRVHDVLLRFDTEGFAVTPYVYRPMTRDDPGVYEEVFLEYVRTLDRTGQYVDVGAHLGTHTVWFAMLCHATHVHAVEPVRRFADVIDRNVRLNELDARVTLHRVGLSDHTGRASNLLSPEHQVGFGEEVPVTEEFPVVRLDDLVRGPVALIKLDVEGMEAAALRGAARILSRYRPVVFAEARDPVDVHAVAQVLQPFGYKATGRIFNAAPTHEFLAPPRRGLERLRPAYRLLPKTTQARIHRAARALRSR